jgi:HAD superfamily hydrolase (TIGR01509 family)
VAQAALLDVDGTLIDSNYQHALAWYRAFRAHDIVLPMWRIHGAVGMGGDQLLPALAGKDVDGERGDAIRDTRDRIYKGELIDEVAPLAGAHDLIVALKERGTRVVLASSSPEDEIERYVDLLDAREVVDAWTTKDDVDATKPAPDLVLAALEKAGTRDAVMVGDTPWDIESARKAGIETVCVITGGWSGQELRDAGAVAVFESAEELCERLGETPLV